MMGTLLTARIIARSDCPSRSGRPRSSRTTSGVWAMICCSPSKAVGVDIVECPRALRARISAVRIVASSSIRSTLDTP